MPTDSPENDWKSAKFQAGLPTMVKNAGDHLKDDGSNYADWEYRVTRLIETVTGRENYLDDSEAHLRDLRGDRVIFSIIDLLVPADIGRRLSGSAQSAMTTIWSLFFFPSCTAHIAAWKEAQDNKLTEDMDIGTYLRKMDMKAMDLEQARFKWTKDSVLGMWYQLGLPSGYANVSMVLNTRLRSQPDQPVSAREVEEAIRAKSQEHGSMSTTTLANFNAIDLNATQMPITGNRRPFCNSIAPNPTDTASHISGAPIRSPMSQLTYTHTFQQLNAIDHHLTPASNIGGASQRRILPRVADLDHCLCCGHTGHWARACPYNQSTGPNLGNRQMRLNLVDVNGTKFTAEVLPDSTVTTDNDALPDGIWALEGNLTEAWDNPDEGVSDTGATHNVTGDMTRLTNIRMLTRPIPVSVATKGPKAYVTHLGTMHLQEDDGSPIPIHNTFYSPAAQRTLLSLPELVELGGSWNVYGKDMVLKAPCGKIVSAKYKDRRWVVPVINTSMFSTLSEPVTPSHGVALSHPPKESQPIRVNTASMGTP
ncbi:hypothetical protein CROQUDRAFT_42602 [Cronartium quercuum f. sp. fusiforme G11]|uniref:CCHC-type domain-containing protein n=1 Tax=Cronartium quercuum f. sp. fusiforme G11 TaxID=708437 RepID=A0A9P6NNY7_9BASI|nr:hypothetical protein CROQUDRAFT_42602 [Cronartium quercuum f. sp. fusiforme G11]